MRCIPRRTQKALEPTLPNVDAECACLGTSPEEGWSWHMHFKNQNKVLGSLYCYTSLNPKP